MNVISEFARRRPAMVSTLRLWLVFLACAGAVALLIAGLQRLESALSPTAMPRAAFTPTFSEAGAGTATDGRVSSSAAVRRAR